MEKLVIECLLVAKCAVASCGFEARQPTTADGKFHLGNHTMPFGTSDLN